VTPGTEDRNNGVVIINNPNNLTMSPPMFNDPSIIEMDPRI